jgi:ABC-2 type transport system permease protein
MRNIFAILKRELRSYFTSPVAYVVMTAFLVIAGWFFFSILAYKVRESYSVDLAIKKYGEEAPTMDVPYSIMKEFFDSLSSMLLLLLPIITMGLIAEEKKRGTMELLLTSPIRDMEIIIGKYLAALGFYLALLLPTGAYLGLLIYYGEPEVPPILAGYLGLFLLGATQIAVGLLISAMTENQIVSAFLSFGVLSMFWFIDSAVNALKSIWQDFARYFSLYVHFTDFSKGVIQLSDVAFFLSFIACCIFLTHRALESIRWRG